MTSQARPANAHTSSWPSGSRYRRFVQHSGALQRTESSGLHFPVGLPPESLALRHSSYTSLSSSDLQIFRSSDPRPPAPSRKLRLRSDICVQPNSSEPTTHSASDLQIFRSKTPGFLAEAPAQIRDLRPAQFLGAHDPQRFGSSDLQIEDARPPGGSSDSGLRSTARELWAPRCMLPHLEARGWIR